MDDKKLSRRDFLYGAAAATAAALSGAAFSGCKSAPVPGPRATKRPNILLLISDQHRSDWVGIYQDRLQKRGELDNTIVVYSSDHGEMLGDHNGWGKLHGSRSCLG